MRTNDPASDLHSAGSTPRVSVVLATRNRAAHVPACVKTILATPGFIELLVIDQSDDNGTELALAQFNEPRIKYVHSDKRGVTNSRNLGAELSTGDVVAFTDDDCRVAADWIPSLQKIFANDPSVAVVCGRVRVADEVQGKGFTESFEPRVREWQGRFPPFGSDWGITANLAVRRSVFETIGYFDPMLGAGAPLRSGGEPDFLFRVLRAGMKIVNASEVTVDHLGVRAPGKDSQKLIRGYGAGTGAAFYKHVRLGDMSALGVYVGFVGANVRRICESVARGKRPDGLGYLMAFFSGSVASYKFKVDRERKQYVPR